MLSRPRPTARGEAGFTLLEIVVVTAVLALILVPLSEAFLVGLRTTTDVGDRVSKTEDAQRIAHYWTHDVQSVDLSGVNDGSTCGTPDPGETTLITFSWAASGDGFTSASPQSAVWATSGSGATATLVRRACTNGVLVSTTTVAAALLAPSWSGPQATASCTTWACTISVGGSYPYNLTVQRRVTPETSLGTTTVPVSGKLTSVSELSTTSAWAVGEDCGLFYYSGGTSVKKDSAVPSGCSVDLSSVVMAGSGATTVAYAVGAGGKILRCAAPCNVATATWTYATSPTTNDLSSVAAAVTAQSVDTRDANSIIVVGAAGTVVECSANCSTTGAFSLESVPAVSGANLTSVALAKWSGGSLCSSFCGYMTAASLTSGKGTMLRCQSGCLAAAPAATPWVVDAAIVPSSATQQLNAVAMSGGQDLYMVAAGNNGEVISAGNSAGGRGGSSFAFSNHSPAGVTQNLTAVSANSTGTLEAGSPGGAVVSQDGTLNAAVAAGASLRDTLSGDFITGVARTSSNSVAFMVDSSGKFIVAQWSAAPHTYKVLPLLQ